ncbi:MAG: 7-carboxy-7-deazaguanine synthase [Bacteroidota bacterium]|nr:7-carboxy-7-deazaguanine synthase [Bacteroidota bacterium]
MYSVKEIFYTLQGEGAQSGRPAVFLRFAGCNLWNGKEADRKNATCNFCDTDFVGTNGTHGGKYDAKKLARKIFELWSSSSGKPFVVCTGGEPLLQLDEELIFEIHAYDFEVAVETNGTIELPKHLDWICMSPKPNTEIKVTSGNELKFVFPQADFSPELFERLKFDYFFIQPMDGPDIATNLKAAVEFCLEHPQWRLSMQTHKLLGIR